jgi:hypothetical protein
MPRSVQFAMFDPRPGYSRARNSPGNSLPPRKRSLSSIERRLDMLPTDMRDLNKAMTALEIDVALLKDKVGL